jgi:NAD(P)-dependent dehydrogenase (short-subunit alcohol dehydrogenase family)
VARCDSSRHAMKPFDTDLSQQTIIVTGANSGIGRQVAKNLASMGAEVILACRSQVRGQSAMRELKAEVPGAKLVLMQLDQSSQESVASFAAEFCERFSRLDVLVNNAGIYPPKRELSVDGIENTWATNVMGYFQLSLALQEKLIASSPSRLLFVASTLAGGLDLEDLQWERRRFGGIKAYKQSKQANRMVAWVFAERLRNSGVTVNVIHPGGVRTGIGRGQKGIWGALVRLSFLTQKPVAEGADTATWLASAPEIADKTGLFWADRKERACEFRDMEQCKKVWEYCEACLA